MSAAPPEDHLRRAADRLAQEPDEFDLLAGSAGRNGRRRADGGKRQTGGQTGGGADDKAGDKAGDQAGDERPGQAFEVLGIGDLLDRVDRMPPPKFLARPVWPADGYGILGAEDKAGKSWAAGDLAVAAASGGEWLGQFPCPEPTGVLLFLGEGGERKTVRRLRAIAEHHGVDLASLTLRVCHRVPHLTDDEHLAQLRAEVDEHRPGLVIIDPLYLAARGAKSSDLYEMGAILEGVQHIAQAAGAALVVVTHWNKTGTGTGRDRFTGAGTKEWGRVLCSMSVDQKRTDGTASVVTLVASFVGDEIADTEHRFTRKVWTDDPDDLASPMHYEVSAVSADRATTSEWDGPTNCMADLREFFTDHPHEELTTTSGPSRLKALGLAGYRKPTVSEALERLAAEGFLAVRSGPRNGRYFRLSGAEGTT